MNKSEFIEELKKRGFVNVPYDDTPEWEEPAWFDRYVKDDCIVDTSNIHGIDVENEVMWPYKLLLNNEIIIGHKRCLLYIDIGRYKKNGS